MLAIEMIDGMPIFESFTDREKKEFIELSRDRLIFDKKEQIITEGDYEKSLFLLVTGTCLVSKTEDNTKIRLAKVSPGEIFGEMSFITSKPRKTTVSAMTDVQVIKMDDAFFGRCHPDIRDKIKNYLIELLTIRLDHMNDSVMNISKLMRT